MKIALTAVKRIISKKSGKDVAWNIVSMLKPDGEALKPVFLSDEDAQKFGVSPASAPSPDALAEVFGLLPEGNAEFNDTGRLESLSLD